MMNRLIISLLLASGFFPSVILAEELRVWYRNDGAVVRLKNVKAITSSAVGDDYGRFIKWEYSVERDNQLTGWTVVGDCKSTSADWDDDREGFIDLRRPSDNSSEEARDVLNQFCPQMNKLIKEAKGLSIRKSNQINQPKQDNRDIDRRNKKNPATRKASEGNPLFDKCKDAADFQGCIDVFTKKRKSPSPKVTSPSIKKEPFRSQPSQSTPPRTQTQKSPSPQAGQEPVLPEKLTPIQKACIDARSTGFRGYYSQRLKIKCRKILKSIPFL